MWRKWPGAVIWKSGPALRDTAIGREGPCWTAATQARTFHWGHEPGRIAARACYLQLQCGQYGHARNLHPSAAPDGLHTPTTLPIPPSPRLAHGNAFTLLCLLLVLDETAHKVPSPSACTCNTYAYTSFKTLHPLVGCQLQCGSGVLPVPHKCCFNVACASMMACVLLVASLTRPVLWSGCQS